MNAPYKMANQSIERDFRFAPAPHAGRYVSKKLQRESEMGLFSSLTKAFSSKEVVFEGASENDRKLFNEIVKQVALIYKTGQQREMFLKLRFEQNVQTAKTESGEIVYRMLGNRSFSKESLYNAYKDGVIGAVRAYTP